MSRRAAAALVALAAAIAAGGGLWLARGRRPAAPPPAPLATSLAAPPAPVAAPERRPATLWLPAAAGRLAAREVEIESSPELAARLAALLAALFAAADDGFTAPVFPAPVAVGSLVLAADGTLYVDLRPADGGAPPGAGSTLEAQRVYAIVHTVLRNEPRVTSVVLLWNGVQRESLAGHVDTRRPLVARPEFEAR
jgi:hypothetical protein